MGNGNSTYGGGQDSAQLLRRFRELDGAYQSAPDAEKEKYFPRRHAALMTLLGVPPQTRDEIAEVMSVALDELAKDLMVPGPVPEAVAAALANCLQAIEDESRFPAERRHIELAAAGSDVPSDVLINLDSEIAKLDKFTGLLAYLANSSDGKLEQSVFFALKNSAEAIRDALLSAVDKLIPTTTTHRQARTPR